MLTTDWVLSSASDDEVPQGLEVAITFPASGADDALVAAGIKAREAAGLPAGSWLLAKVRNDSDSAASLTSATVVTGDRQQLKLDTGVMMLNEISQTKADKYTDAVSALNQKMSELQGYDIKPGTDATVIYGTPDAVAGGVMDLYISLNGRELTALTGAEAKATSSTTPSAPPAVEGDLPDGATAEQVAGALGCSTYKGQKPKKEESTGITPTSRGLCNLGGTRYTVYTYGEPEQLTQTLVVGEAFAKAFKISFQVGVGSWWTVATDGDAPAPLPADMADALTAVGAEVRQFG